MGVVNHYPKQKIPIQIFSQSMFNSCHFQNDHRSSEHLLRSAGMKLSTEFELSVMINIFIDHLPSHIRPNMPDEKRNF